MGKHYRARNSIKRRGVLHVPGTDSETLELTAEDLNEPAAGGLTLGDLVESVSGSSISREIPPPPAAKTEGSDETGGTEDDEPLTPLPMDFPGREALEESGLVWVEEVPRSADDLVAIAGVGRRTAQKILAGLG